MPDQYTLTVRKLMLAGVHSTILVDPNGRYIENRLDREEWDALASADLIESSYREAGCNVIRTPGIVEFDDNYRNKKGKR